MDEAVDAFKEALIGRRQAASRAGEAATLGALGLALRRRGELAEAVAHLEQWREAARQAGDRHGEAQALSNLGNAYRQQGRAAAARQAHEEAVALERGVGHVRGLGIALINLGTVHQELGDLGMVRTSLELMASWVTEGANPKAQEDFERYLLGVLHAIGEPPPEAGRADPR